MGRGLCYYEVLGLPRSADDVDIKKAFRRLALKHHPDTDASPEGRAEFARACEAYDVLSSAKTKAVYDVGGEEALKAPQDDGGSAYAFDASSGPAAVFARFFGTANPYEALNMMSAQFEQLTTKPKLQPGKQEELELLVPLGDIHAGCVRVVRHTRRRLHEDGSEEQEERSLRVVVAPGAVDGTRYTFQGEGDIVPGALPGTVVLLLRGAPHPVFSRCLASDLVAAVPLPLVRALTGGSVSINTLDGRVLAVPLQELVTPGLTMRVAGEGMPLPGGGGAKGDLLLELSLVFPPSLSQQQKMLLKAALYLPHKPDTVQSKALRVFEAAFRDAAHGWSTGVVHEDGGPPAAC